MFKKLLVCSLAGLVASVAAYASENLSYNYVQAEYASVETDNGPDGDGLARIIHEF